MDKRNTFIIIGIFLAIALTTLLFVDKAPAPVDVADTRPAVAATIFPLADIVRNVAGDALRVDVLLPPGASPHSFEPSPSELRRLRGSAVVYAIGHGLDDWSEGLGTSVGVPRVVVDRGITLREGAAHEDEHEEDEAEGAEESHEDEEATDPHYWLDARNAALIAATVRDDLSARFPALAPTFAENAARYEVTLAALHSELIDALRGSSARDIVTLHDAWYYFADAYGFRIVGTFEPTAGREPTPQYLVELIEAVRSTGTTRVYSEPQLATGSIEPFARDYGLEVRTIDPIGGVEGRMSYEELMRDIARTMAGE